jgi:hypothetical protein
MELAIENLMVEEGFPRAVAEDVMRRYRRKLARDAKAEQDALSAWMKAGCVPGLYPFAEPKS